MHIKARPCPHRHAVRCPCSPMFSGATRARTTYSDVDGLGERCGCFDLSHRSCGSPPRLVRTLILMHKGTSSSTLTGILPHCYTRSLCLVQRRLVHVLIDTFTILYTSIAHISILGDLRHWPDFSSFVYICLDPPSPRYPNLYDSTKEGLPSQACITISRNSWQHICNLERPARPPSRSRIPNGCRSSCVNAQAAHTRLRHSKHLRTGCLASLHIQKKRKCSAEEELAVRETIVKASSRFSTT